MKQGHIYLDWVFVHFIGLLTGVPTKSEGLSSAEKKFGLCFCIQMVAKSQTQ